MTIPLARDPLQWTQHIKNPFFKWRSLASSSHADVFLLPAFISTPVKICLVETSDGHVIKLPVNRLGESPPPMSTVAYFDRFSISLIPVNFDTGCASVGIF